MFWRLSDLFRRFDRAFGRFEQYAEPLLQQALKRAVSAVDSFVSAVELTFYALPRLVWNLIILIGAIALEVMWLGFLFGSVVGVVLVLIFAPALFLMPMALLVLWVRISPEENS